MNIAAFKQIPGAFPGRAASALPGCARARLLPAARPTMRGALSAMSRTRLHQAAGSAAGQRGALE
jgi:hypothetical protein